MAQTSSPWNGTTVGDAAVAPYDAPTEFASWQNTVSGASGVETNLSAVILEGNFPNPLCPTDAGSQVLRVSAGHAINYGTWYENSSNADTAIPIPGAATRIDRIVLRKDWTLQTVRVTRVAGVEGGAAAALVQLAGTTWDQPICQVSITTGGAMTITDERQIISVRPIEVVCGYAGAPTVATGYSVILNTELYKSLVALHSNSVNNTRFTAPVKGVYEISFRAGAQGTDPYVQFRQNNTTEVARASLVGTVFVLGHAFVSLAAGDYIEFIYNFGGGGSQTISNINAQMRYVGLA